MSVLDFLNPFAPVINLVSNVAGLISDNVKQKREIQAAAAQNTIKLLQDEQSNNHAWEMANLTDKDVWLRRGSFLMFTYPLLWAAYDPHGAATYFNVILASLPEWYKQIVFTMIGGIWGVAAMKNVVPGLVGETLKAINGLREKAEE